jgi:hypothetical protein
MFIDMKVMCPRYRVVSISNSRWSRTCNSPWLFLCNMIRDTYIESERICVCVCVCACRRINKVNITKDSEHNVFSADKEALPVRYACFRPADCQRSAGNHEYVQELSQQVFSKQQRVQVYMRIVPRPGNRSRTAQLLFHFYTIHPES